MRKYVIFLCLFFVPFFTFASFDQNLYYGLTKNNSVKDLQQFLIGKGFLTGQATGNFFTATQKAVKKYQASKKISATGVVGPITRQALNDDSLIPQNTNQDAIVAQNITNQNSPFSGTLDLVVDTSFKDQSISSSKLKAKLADFSLKNNTNEILNLNKVEVGFTVNNSSNFVDSSISNFYVTFDGNKVADLKVVSGGNYLPINFKLLAGQTVDMSIFADINSSVQLNSIINSNILVSGVSAISNSPIFSNLNKFLTGQIVTINTGALTATQDSSTPSANIYIANQKIVAGKFQFNSIADYYNVSDLKFIIPDLDNSIPLISKIVLSDTLTGTILGTSYINTNYTNNNSVFDFNNLNIVVAQNSSKSITLEYYFNKIIDSRGTNINIAPVLVYMKAVNDEGLSMDGVASGYNNFSTLYNNIVFPSNGVLVNDLRVFKSLPTITNIPLENKNILNGQNTDLYKFSVKADQNGDISLKQLTFIVSLTNPNNTFPWLSELSLFKESSSFKNSVYVGKVVNNSFSGLVSDSGDGVGMGAVNNIVVLTFDKEEVIPAGKTQIYTLRAKAKNFMSSVLNGHDSISVYMPADTEPSLGSNYFNTAFSKFYFALSKKQGSPFSVESLTYRNLIWSDMSEPFPNIHYGGGGEFTKDWYGGYKILNLPLATQTITAN